MSARRQAVLPETGRRLVLKGGSHEQLAAGVPQPHHGGIRQTCQQEDRRFYQKQVGD